MAAAMDYRKRVDIGAQSGQRITGELDAIRESRGIERESLFGGCAIGVDGGDGYRAQVNLLTVVRPDDRAVVGGIAGPRELQEQAEVKRFPRETGLEFL